MYSYQQFNLETVDKFDWRVLAWTISSVSLAIFRSLTVVQKVTNILLSNSKLTYPLNKTIPNHSNRGVYIMISFSLHLTKLGNEVFWLQIARTDDYRGFGLPINLYYKFIFNTNFQFNFNHCSCCINYDTKRQPKCQWQVPSCRMVKDISIIDGSCLLQVPPLWRLSDKVTIWLKSVQISDVQKKTSVVRITNPTYYEYILHKHIYCIGIYFKKHNISFNSQCYC